MRDPLLRIVILAALACIALMLAINSGPDRFDLGGQATSDGTAVEVEVYRPQAVLGRLGQDLLRAGKDTDPELIRSRLGEVGSPVREAMRGKLYVDFALIASYAVFFLGAGLLITRGTPGWPALIGRAVVLFGLLGAAADTAENITALSLLDLAPEAINVDELQRIGLTNLVKWSGIAMALFNAGLGFLLVQYSKRRRALSKPA